jgi:hypothetical protein
MVLERSPAPNGARGEALHRPALAGSRAKRARDHGDFPRRGLLRDTVSFGCGAFKHKNDKNFTYDHFFYTTAFDLQFSCLLSICPDVPPFDSKRTNKWNSFSWHSFCSSL